MEHAVCKFIPISDIDESIQTLQFVYETDTEPKIFKNNFYRIFIISEGEGIIRHSDSIEHISKGDMFFTFLNKSYSIEATSDNFKYMYISYVGIRAAEALNTLKISSTNNIFRGFNHLIQTWKTGVNLSNDVSQFSSEAVLLMSFAALGNDKLISDDRKSKAEKTVTNIKNYIDDNFPDPDLSLEKVSAELFYSKKYVSHAFKSEMQMGFSDYVNHVRMQHAYTLMDKGMTSIKEISLMCGFRDALYFSKLFKQKTLKTPTEYIKSISERKNKK